MHPPPHITCICCNRHCKRREGRHLQCVSRRPAPRKHPCWAGVCVCVCVCVCIMNYMEILISYVSDISITWDREENAILDKNGPVNNKLHKQLIFPWHDIGPRGKRDTGQEWTSSLYLRSHVRLPTHRPRISTHSPQDSGLGLRG